MRRSLCDVAVDKFAGSALLGGDILPSGGTRITEPDALAPFHRASADERKRRVRDVLQWASSIYRRGGYTMVEAVAEASAGSATGHYALVELRRVLLELNLPAWEAHPSRVRGDIHRTFRKAIGRLTPHRGGWQVTR